MLRRTLSFKVEILNYNLLYMWSKQYICMCAGSAVVNVTGSTFFDVPLMANRFDYFCSLRWLPELEFLLIAAQVTRTFSVSSYMSEVSLPYLCDGFPN